MRSLQSEVESVFESKNTSLFIKKVFVILRQQYLFVDFESIRTSLYNLF